MPVEFITHQTDLINIILIFCPLKKPKIIWDSQDKVFCLINGSNYTKSHKLNEKQEIKSLKYVVRTRWGKIKKVICRWP